MKLTAVLRTFVPFSLVGAVTFFFLLWIMDYPKPMVDDLFYTGAALHLAEGGDFSNPLLARQEFPSHYFFVYPPLHSYSLAVWLKIFGVSARSMTAFPILMYCIIAAAAIAILRRHRAPPLLAWLVPLAVSTSLLPVGLRAEPLAIALTMAGFAIFEWTRIVEPLSQPSHAVRRKEAGVSNVPLSRAWAKIIFQFIGFLLMFLGASAAPRMAFFSAALILFSICGPGRQTDSVLRDRIKLFVTAVIAAMITFLLFLAQIHFRLAEFWHTFHIHSQRVGGRRVHLLLKFLDENPYLNNAQVPLLWALVTVLIFTWRPPMTGTTRIAFFLIMAFPFVMLAGGLGAGTLWYTAFTLLLYSAAILKSSPIFASKITLFLLFLFVLANAEIIAIAYGKLTGKIKIDKGDQEQTALALRSTPSHPILVDHSVARYVFDYKIPPGFLDIQFAAPFPKSHIVGQIRPGDIYLVGPENIDVLKDSTLLDVPVLKWEAFTMPNRQFYMRPRQVFVIPAENCPPRLSQ